MRHQRLLSVRDGNNLKRLFHCTGCGLQMALREKDFPIRCRCGFWVLDPGPPITNGDKPQRSTRGATVDDATFEARMETCRNCPSGEYVNGFCRLCPACNNGRAQTFERRVRMQSMRCPMGYWLAKTNSAGLSYISSAQRTLDTLSLVPRLPPDLAAVCGVARSGIAPAVELAMALHLPLFTLSEQHGVVPAGFGYRLAVAVGDGPILVIDDSRGTGRSARRAMKMASRHWPDRKIIHAALYVNRLSMQRLPRTELWVHEMDDWHLFEWNLHNSPFFAGKIAYDMDGVICQDWPAAQNYERFLDSAPPLWLPRRDTVPMIVTGRLERYRPQTEQWLARWGVRAERLVMWPGDEEERWRGRPLAVAAWKADHYAASGLSLMVESDERQAREISELTGKAVLCPSAGKVFQCQRSNGSGR